jgi:hypothetical protein
MLRGRESGPFFFAAARQVKQFEIGEADFGGRRHGFLIQPHSETTEGAAKAAPFVLFIGDALPRVHLDAILQHPDATFGTHEGM